MTAPLRLRSLDIFRGLAVAGMILVNNPGSWGHFPTLLRHAPWHGWTLADLVFPFFLLAVGLSIPLSFSRAAAAGASRGALVRKTARRALVLFVLGLLLHLLMDRSLTTLRIPGVLQRIAVCSLGASAAFLFLGRRGRIALTVLLLAGHWALLALAPVPGVGAGILTPEGSFSGFVDRLLLGPHVWSQTESYDPEGIVSTLSALASTLLGVLAGEALLAPMALRRRSALFVSIGCFLAAAGQGWSIVLPINKPIWTGSYALFAGGLGLVAFGFLHGATDRDSEGASVDDETSPGPLDALLLRPLEDFGRNALAVFVASGAANRLLALVPVLTESGRTRSAKGFLVAKLAAVLPSLDGASLAWALLNLAFWFLVARAMADRKLFLKA
jgi:predicted acyltransferase